MCMRKKEVPQVIVSSDQETVELKVVVTILQTMLDKIKQFKNATIPSARDFDGHFPTDILNPR